MMEMLNEVNETGLRDWEIKHGGGWLLLTFPATYACRPTFHIFTV